MTEKSYVGMAQCFLCGEVKHLLLDRRLKNTLERQACYDHEPCDKCKEYMQLGVIFIGVKDGEEGKQNPYRTGGFWVVKEEAVKRLTQNEEILKKRVCFIEESGAKKIGLKRGEKND